MFSRQFRPWCIGRTIIARQANLMTSCKSCHCSTGGISHSSKYRVREVGSRNSLEYRGFIENEQGQVISPFHDIPLYPEAGNRRIVNMVVEIPRWTNGKLEICKEELMNPIKQDVKKGQLRYVKNCFPYHGYLWNYGALPQTWENPSEVDHSTGYKGDNDPIDVIEIGDEIGGVGQVKQVKILGCLALIDEGETDWKIFAIDVNDPMAGKLDGMTDVETYCPGLIEATRNWFRIYKIPDGKSANNFAFDGQVRDCSFAERIVEETFGAWKSLIMGRSERHGIACENRMVKDSPFGLTNEQEGLIPKSAGSEPCKELPIPPTVSHWSFIIDKSN